MTTFEGDFDPVVDVRSNDKSREFVRKVNYDIFSISGCDASPTEDDPLTVDIPLRIMSVERMHNLCQGMGYLLVAYIRFLWIVSICPHRGL